MSTLPELLEKLQTARADAIYLATNLLAASHRFGRDNLMPSLALAHHIEECRQSFDAVRAEVAEFIGPDYPEERARVETLESIEEIIATLQRFAAHIGPSFPETEDEEETGNNGVSAENGQGGQSPESPLARVLRMRHATREDFAPLASSQELAQLLLEEIESGTMDEGKDVLAQGFEDLVRLVEERDTLEEAEVLRLREEISQHFGRGLAQAAWNREIVVVEAAVVR